MGSDGLARRVERAAREAAAPSRPEVEVLSDSPPLLLAEEAPIHRALLELTGAAPGGSVSLATDAGWLQQLGLDCAIWGPGSIAVAHRPDEHLPKDQFYAARAHLEEAVAIWREFDADTAQASALEEFAVQAAARGQPERALRLAGAATEGGGPTRSTAPSTAIR